MCIRDRYGLLLEHPQEEKLKRLVITTALLRKGRAAEAGTMANRLLHQSRNNPQTKQRFEKWQQIRQQREALLYGGDGNQSPVAYQAQLKELSQQADDLESQLAAAMPELRKLQPPKFEEIVAAVAARLPKDGVLFEEMCIRDRCCTSHRLLEEERRNRWCGRRKRRGCCISRRTDCSLGTEISSETKRKTHPNQNALQLKQKLQSKPKPSGSEKECCLETLQTILWK